jgi:nitrogenase molybdenum-iron protein NifN
MDGFHGAVRALVEQLAVEPAPASRTVNVMPGFVSAADLRHLRALVRAFGVEPVLLPDYADTLDGPALEDYQTIPSGGTPVAAYLTMGGALGSIECGRVLAGAKTTAGTALAQRFGVPLARVGLPIGLRETDAFVAALEAATGTPMPRELELERGRLVDAYVDGHKYVFGKRAVVYGEEDLVIGLTALLAEMGVRPVLCATGARGEGFGRAIAEVCEGLMPELPQVPRVRTSGRSRATPGPGAGPAGRPLQGLPRSAAWTRPGARGFPIHDRFGGQRLRHLGYGARRNCSTASSTPSSNASRALPTSATDTSRSAAS